LGRFRQCASDARRRKIYGALHLGVTAVASLFLLAFNPLVVLNQGLLLQLVGLGRFVSRQRPVGGRCPPGKRSRKVRMRFTRRA
jgi:hypothetical protein